MLEFINEQLNDLMARNLYRRPFKVSRRNGCRVVIEGEELLSFASNDYLGLSEHPEVVKAAAEAAMKHGVGTGASRLIQGTMGFHRSLEEKIAEFKGCEDALVFTSGYMANVGVLTALIDEDDVVISDEYNHASIVDACRMSGATVVVYPHKNMERLNQALEEYSLIDKIIVVTEGLFSVDGDLAPLREIAALAGEHGAYTLVDDAHALGVFGRDGRGAIEHCRVKGKVDFITGTLSKAVGGLGGFAAGSMEFIDLLRNRARSFIYTTAPPAGVCAAAEKALEIMMNDPEPRRRLWGNVNHLLKRLGRLRLQPLHKESHIISIALGSAEAALEASRELLQRGILAPALRPPTVPEGTSRLRLSVTAQHTREDIDLLAEALEGIDIPAAT
jgi:8-amino-7-oxononanoate synthase